MGRKKKVDILNESKSKESVDIKKVTAKKMTAKERLKKELDEMSERNARLGNLLGKVRSNDARLLDSLNGEQKKLLAKQYMMQNKLIHIMKRRLEIWTEIE